MTHDLTERILIIDDDVKFTALLSEYLQGCGFSTDIALDGLGGLGKLRNGMYAAVILDVILPEMTGWDVLRELRRESPVPVLMLTGLSEESGRILGLELGADDYLQKTFSLRELQARLRAVLRRSTVPRPLEGANTLPRPS